MGHPQLQAIRRVLIANRGEIAVRCINACRALGVTSVAIYTASDASSLHVTSADESVLLQGDGTPGYLDVNDILDKCRQLSIDAVIPGYGFLSENVDFASRVTDAGMVFVGPSSESITEMGLKHRAREVATSVQVPVVPGTGLLVSEDDALAEADRLTYPVMLKATGGGGGMGLQVCHSDEDLRAAFGMVRNRGEKLFRNAGILLEKYYPKSHHIEVQVFGNGTDVIHLGERECSIQRRHQKVIEECPSPFVEMRPGLREKLTTCATKYASALNYKSAGTVEFLVDDETGDFFFLEMNTRLQVEHGITELCYGVDLVILMLRQADLERAGHGGILSSDLQGLQRTGPDGAAIEARIYAESPYRGFAPSPGIMQEVRWPEQDGVRIDTWIQSGQHVGLHYDPLLAKVMVHSGTRDQAIAKFISTCSQDIALRGPATNLDFVRAVMDSDSFAKGVTLTNFLDTSFVYHPCGIDVINAGSYSTVQDFPARPTIGHGIPKGGPMDSKSARVANLLAGNPSGTELIEITLIGPELLFTTGAVVSVCGAHARVTIDGVEKPMWSTLTVKPGQTLNIGAVDGPGCRIYLAVRGGFPEIPIVMGSKATVPSLKFGGCQGRTLCKGDFLQLDSDAITQAPEYTLPSSLIPDTDIKEIYVMQGPHDSQDIMTDADREMLYNTMWKVGYNSSRTGVRMVGPAPQWARTDGGEGGSHPSNYLDYGYPSPGGVNWGGDSPCIFSADSPNFGGLICSSTVISADLWKLGQLKPGEDFCMTPVSLSSSIQQILHNSVYFETVELAIRDHITKEDEGFPRFEEPRCPIEPNSAIIKVVEASAGTPPRPKVTYRQGGDRYLLIEFGEQVTDVAILARIRLFLDRLRSEPKLTLLTPHVGSVMIEYDPLEITQGSLLKLVDGIEGSVETRLDISIPCREIRLPLVMDHPAVQECIRKYIATTRSKAAYLPDNLDFIRKCNGLASKRDAFEMLTKTEYLVAAVGFLCGAPMLFPLSPKKLLCPKYNPTRVSTPGGTLGLGGTILAAYPCEQPGGYMMAARTLELWDPYGTKPGFTQERPWLFEAFDRVKFHEVSVDEYDAIMLDFSAGKHQWDISPSTFDLGKAYEIFQKSQTDPDVISYKDRQLRDMAAQDQVEKQLYAEWVAETSVEEDPPSQDDDDATDDDGTSILITSPMTANLWRLEVSPGDEIEEGQVIAILEAMKMEVNVPAPRGSGGFRVKAIHKKPGKIVNNGDTILVLAQPS
ncbi:urea carboxylase [Geosmithia morbida]|uniref:Urea carboxylase n=1 Tax=Geosmithia morbida TaxID=1094350 RepID=A0A9P5CZD4_9HYPO|nr:urea carboxylase [Geosmithia morbida]KAF4121458.1 urea carboxylase [Geosmithia morbida]